MHKKILVIIILFLVQNGFSQQNPQYIKDWGTYFGGQGTQLWGSKIDSEGNLIAYGGVLTDNSTNIKEDYAYFNSFLVNSNNFSGYTTNIYNGIIVKISPQGIVLKAIYLPFIFEDFLLDSANNIYISGTTEFHNLGTANAWFTNPLNNNESQPFLAKLNPDFTTQWFSYLPANIYDIVLDDQANVYGIGYTRINQNITTAGVFQESYITHVHNNEILDNGYLFKVNTNGQLNWATYFGVDASGSALAILNNEIITAFHVNPNLIISNPEYASIYVTPDAFQSTEPGTVLAKFNKNTGNRNYSTYISNTIKITDIVTDDSAFYILGGTDNPIQNSSLLTNAFQNTFGGVSDLYLGKFSANVQPIWGTYIGGEDYDAVFSFNNLSIKNNALFVTSEAFSNHIPGINSTYQSTNNGLGDLLIMKYGKDGNLVWGSFFGGTSSEFGGSITPINENEFFLVGTSLSLNQISTAGSHQPTLNIHPNYPRANFGNGYIVKFVPDPQLSVPSFNENLFTIYPNPTNGQNISITGNLKSSYSVELFSILGQKISSYKLKDALTQNLNLNNLSSGTYILKITDGNNVLHTNKIIVN